MLGSPSVNFGVDATYRSDLRELNELNFARFDAKLEQRVAELDAKFERRLSELEVKFGQRLSELEVELKHLIAEFEARVEQRFAAIEKRFNAVEQRFTAVNMEIVGLRGYVETRFAEQDSKLDQRISGLRAELVKWMFVFWIGTLAPLAGLIVILTR